MGHQYISIAGVAVYLFWFYHLFFQTTKDFYQSTYLYYGIAISFLVVFFVYELSKYFARKDSWAAIIRKLFNFLFVEVEKKDFIKDEKKKEFVKRRVELAKYAMDNE